MGTGRDRGRFDVRRGRRRVAGWLTAVALWALLTVAAFFTGGVQGPTPFGYLVVVIVACLFLGERTALLFAGLSVAAGLGLAWLGDGGLLPPPPTILRPFPAWAVLSIYLVAAAAALAAGGARLERALGRARDREGELLEELERRVAGRNRELRAMVEVMAAANEYLELEATLEHLLEPVLDAVGADRGAIQLLDEGSKLWCLVVQRGIPRDRVAQFALMSQDEGPGGWIAEHDEPIVVADATADPRMGFFSLSTPHRYAGVAMRAGGQVVGILSVIRGSAQPEFDEEEVALLSSLADRIGGVVESHRLRQLAERAAVLEERQRLARDLHDSVTQSLYSTTLLAETGRQAAEAGDLETAGNCLTRLVGVARQALKEMRVLIYELRPPVLEQVGLVGALQQRLDAVEGRSGVAARLLVEGEVALPALQEEALYRIAVEALNNAIKHAQATAVTIAISADAECVKLEITDDGLGFDPQAASRGGGMGLTTMRGRADQVGGALAIESGPERGTRVTMSFRTRSFPRRG